MSDRFDTSQFVLEASPDGSSRVLASAGATATESDVTTDSGTATAHAPADVPAAVPPTELAERTSRINALVTASRLDEAYALATELRETLTDAAGADDPHALEARALEAYIAHQYGDHREAIVLALGVARIRCSAEDRQAPEDVVRAAAAWQRLDDDRAIVAHGRELLHMWDRLDHRGLLPPAHAELVGRVRRRVDKLDAS
ncbi:hypothetical protein [Streptomyces sp. NPDC056663]|uniref:hypothetical protein n=1 Tax=Streptomyces sp. NPDC056663 TaxID=3345899 RepID=UPI00369FC805